MIVKRIGNIFGDNKGTGFAGNVWDKHCLCPTITTMNGGYREPLIVEEINESMVCQDGWSESTEFKKCERKLI